MAGRHYQVIRSLALTFSVGFVRLYQYTLGACLLPACRFEPTCSRYAILALRQHGFWRGWMLSLRRLSRCHPWHRGGFDPVPQNVSLIEVNE